MNATIRVITFVVAFAFWIMGHPLDALVSLGFGILALIGRDTNG